MTCRTCNGNRRYRLGDSVVHCPECEAMREAGRLAADAVAGALAMVLLPEVRPQRGDAMDKWMRGNAA